MEGTKSPTRRKSGRKRKPLIDLSNITPSSQPSSQSSSSSTTLIQPQIKSSLKSIPPNSILTATGSTVNVNKDNDKENRKSSNSKANPSSKLSTPSESPFISVYKRPTAERRKSKEKGVAEPLSCIFGTRIPDLRKKDGDGDIGISKSCPMPHKKKQRRVKAEINASKHDLPQDFIDKQRAYFAEVDAFELEEEVEAGNESN